MMKRQRCVALLALGAGLLSTERSPARVVDYAKADDAFTEDAALLKIQPLSVTPLKSTWNISFDAATGVDHITLALGMYCSAYKVENPVTAMFERLIVGWDQDGILGNTTPGTPQLAIHLAEARSYRRCVELKEMNARCITRVTFKGDARFIDTNGAERQFPVIADVERDASIGGICGNLAKGIGVVTHQAGITFIADAVRQANMTVAR